MSVLDAELRANYLNCACCGAQPPPPRHKFYRCCLCHDQGVSIGASYCGQGCQAQDWNPHRGGHKTWHTQRDSRIQARKQLLSRSPHLVTFELLRTTNYASEIACYRELCGSLGDIPSDMTCASCLLADGIEHLQHDDFRKADNAFLEVLGHRPEIPDTYFFLAVSSVRSNFPLRAALLHLQYAKRAAACIHERAWVHGTYPVPAGETGEFGGLLPGTKGWRNCLNRAITPDPWRTGWVIDADRPSWWDNPTLQSTCRAKVAFAVQALFRGRRCRRSTREQSAALKARSRAVVTLQASQRRRSSMRSYHCAKQAAVTLQAAARARPPRKQLSRIRKLATRVQAHSRGRRCRRNWPQVQRAWLAELAQERQSLRQNVRTLEKQLAQESSLRFRDREIAVQRVNAILAERTAQLESQRGAMLSAAAADAEKALQQVKDEAETRLARRLARSSSELAAAQDQRQRSEAGLQAATQQLEERQAQCKELAAQLRRQATVQATEQQASRAALATARRAEAQATDELLAANARAATESEERAQLQVQVFEAQEAQRSFDGLLQAAAEEARRGQEQLEAAREQLSQMRAEPEALSRLAADDLRELQRIALEAQLRLSDALETRRRDEERARRQAHEELEAAMLCTVCMAQPRSVLLQPCGHWLLCLECSGRVEHCPVCRENIVRRIRGHAS